MKVLLINPPSEMLKQEGFGIMPPLGILYIGGVLEKVGHQVKIVDCVAQNWKNPKKFSKDNETIYRFDVEDDFWQNLFSEFQPSLIGIANLFATSENICIDLAKKVKNLSKDAKIVIGGTNATSRAKLLLEENSIDFVIRGEGEYALRDLIRCLEQNSDFKNIAGLCYKNENKLFITSDYNWVKDLDELPFPAYHLLTCSVENYFTGHFPAFSLEKRILVATTSRGCVNNCVFCSGMKNLGIWRARDPEKVIKELFFLKQTYGIKEISFVDPNIGLHKDRFIKLMELMIESNLKLKWIPNGGIYIQTFTPDLVKLMRKSGCHSIYLAIEHGDPKMQKYIGKIVPLDKIQAIVKECKKHGIWAYSYWVLGLPGETKESLECCIEYAKKADLDGATFFIATPIPGSRLYEKISDNKDIDTENLRMTSKNIWWTDMDPNYLRDTVRRFLIEFAKHRIINDLKPKNMFFRIKNLSLANIKMYLKLSKRFFEWVIFR